MKVSTKKNISKASTRKKATVVVSEAVGNYEKHPFFIKKANAARELLSTAGLPKSLYRKQVS